MLVKSLNLTVTSSPSVPSASTLLPEEKNRTLAFSGLWSAFSKMAYSCNISILQREGPRKALGQRSHGVNFLFLPLSPYFSAFYRLLFQMPSQGG